MRLVFILILLLSGAAQAAQKARIFYSENPYPVGGQFPLRDFCVSYKLSPAVFAYDGTFKRSTVWLNRDTGELREEHDWTKEGEWSNPPDHLITRHLVRRTIRQFATTLPYKPYVPHPDAEHPPVIFNVGEIHCQTNPDGSHKDSPGHQAWHVDRRKAVQHWLNMARYAKEASPTSIIGLYGGPTLTQEWGLPRDPADSEEWTAEEKTEFRKVYDVAAPGFYNVPGWSMGSAWYNLVDQQTALLDRDYPGILKYAVVCPSTQTWWHWDVPEFPPYHDRVMPTGTFIKQCRYLIEIKGYDGIILWLGGTPLNEDSQRLIREVALLNIER